METNKKVKTKKEYQIEIDLKYTSGNIKVQSTSLSDAKKKAFERFKTNLKMKDCNFYY